MNVIIAYVARWIHIASATLAIGGPFFVRFALLPAATKVLDDDAHKKLRETVNYRWKHVVYVVITLFLLTGFYTFFVETRWNGQLITGRWREFGDDDRKLYQMLFGIKFMAALGMFFLASALAGRAEAFSPIRRNARTWLSVFLMLALIVLTCATMMRYLPRGAVIPPSAKPPVPVLPGA